MKLEMLGEQARVPYRWLARLARDRMKKETIA
jgi:hypothetical protein